MVCFSRLNSAKKSEKRKKNADPRKRNSRQEGQITYLPCSDHDADKNNAGTHAAHHGKQQPRGLNHGRYRDRHNWDLNAAPVHSYKKDERSAVDQILPKISVPFVPPKPNEFFTAILIGIARAELAQ